MKKFGLLAVALCLTACGGGGGGGASPSGLGTLGTGGVNVPAPPVYQASSIDNSVTTYTTTEPEVKNAFDRLSAERSQCGFGALRQSQSLELAARNHADWQNLNNYTSHSEISGTLGYTGVTPLERTAYAGYAGVDVSEGLTRYVGRTSKSGMGESESRTLLLAPYHMLAMLRGTRDVGIAIRNSVDVNASVGGVVTEFELGYLPSDGKQLPSSSDVLTYPCDGVIGTRYKLTSETPQVEASRNYITNPTGQPIYVVVREGNNLTVSSASVVNALTGSSIATKSLTYSNDRNGMLRPNEVLVIPDVALEPSTPYAVVLTGSNSGVAFTRSFSFTTGI